MKDLTVHHINSRNVEFMENVANQELLKCTINPSYNEIYILLDKHLYGISNEKNSIYDIDKNQYSLSKIVAMDYCVALQELYCACESGCLARIEVINEQCINYKIIQLETSLQCMKFSPDYELIAAVSNTGFVITMALNFQVMSEVDLYTEEFGQNEFVTVGWGKKETQFHGSLGKTAAQAKSVHLIPNEHDDGHIRIAWRNDGAFFVVSFLHKETKIRKFKIFDREGILCYTSEQINGLEECIAWGPMERPIAVPQILDEKYVVAFFEKNGLKYSELLLPFKPQEAKVKDLFWSPCLDILTVVCYQIKTNTTLIQLWTENNCHWYLKQTLVFTEDIPLLYVTWSDRLNQFDMEELIYLTTEEITFCSFNWCVNHSRGKTVDDKVIVGVIDGNNILITGFKDGIIPPPMAHQYLQTSESQNAIVFAPDINNKSSLNSNDFCAVSCNNKLTFFKQKFSTLTYEVINSCNIDFGKLYDIETLKVKKIHYYMHNFLWFTEDIMLFSTITDEHNLLCVLSLDERSSKDHLTIQKIYVLDYPIEYIISSPDANTAYIKAKEHIFKYTQDRKLEQINITLYKLCIQMEVIKINLKDVILALSPENSFLIDGKEIAKNITSFHVHSDFLILTTLQHTLICVPLNEVGLKQLSVHDLTVKPWLSTDTKMSFTNIYIRRLEKDSRIITAVPQDSKIILQMPRGNLECIQPRALSLHILKSYLNNCNYLAALDMMTKQRINLNLIYDHNPQLFMANVKKFVEDIVQHKKLNWLNLFLSELQNEDVISTMYANCYVDPTVKFDVKGNETNDNETVNKIDKVCKLLRDVMEEHHDANNLIQPILISLVKNQQRQGLENALNKIKQIKMLEEQKVTVDESSVSASEALKYLLHFVNIDVLYDIALGMYDFKLAMFIASKSSKDPKEYVPLLNNLKKLNENYMKYSINVYLKRYETALEFLSKDSTKFDECLDFIRNQKLYKMAIKLFKKNTIEHKKVAAIYGEFLLSEQKYSEAGMMFYRSGDLNKALETFSMSNDNWEDVIIILKEMKLSPIDLHGHCKILVEHLKAGRKYEQAAIILKEYLNDIEEAVALLCEGRIWKHAIRLTTDGRRLDLNETHIKPGIKEHAEHVISQLSKMKKDFLNHKSRLAVVRTELKVKQIELLREKTCNDESEFDKEILDSISDTISIADSTLSRISQLSISSSKSYRSSKNRRKQARKLLSLKKGSMFEDLSLIHALYQIINNAYKDRDEWYQLVQVLIRFEFDEKAAKILIEEKEFFQLVESSKSEIWDRSASTSLANIEKNANYTQAQLQEIIAPIKLMERYIMFPPEADTPPRVLNIF